MNNDETKLPIDILMNRERIRGASRMIRPGTDPKDVTPEQIEAVITDTQNFITKYKLSQGHVARAIGKSPGVLSDFLANRYPGKNQEIAIDLDAYLDEEEKRRTTPATTSFVWTNVARQIESVANYCLDKKKIGLVYGPDTAGLGKTIALEAIHADIGNRRSTLVTVNATETNQIALLTKIAVGLGIKVSGNATKRFNAIVEKLNGRSHLLMIDEIHNLCNTKGDKPFYILKDLYNATKSAQLWCGTADLVAYLARQRINHADESLAQVASRMYPCVNLIDKLKVGGPEGKGEPLVTVEQVREMFASNKLKITSTAARFLFQIINTPDTGGIRFCVQIVECANEIAEDRGMKSIDVDVLRAAMTFGITSVRAENLIQRVEQESVLLRKFA